MKIREAFMKSTKNYLNIGDKMDLQKEIKSGKDMILLDTRYIMNKSS